MAAYKDRNMPRQLKLPLDVLEKAVERSRERGARLRKGGRAASPFPAVKAGDRPAGWDYMSPSDKKQWLARYAERAQVQRVLGQESTSLHDRMFTESWKAALAYGMSTPERFGGPPEEKKKKDRPRKPKVAITLRRRLLGPIVALGKAAFPEPRP